MRIDLNCDMGEGFGNYKIGALKGFCTANGTKLTHVKPHGNLYLTAVEDAAVAMAVATAIVSVDSNLMYVALAGAKGELMTKIGKEVGLKVVYEAFPDRAYTPEGSLVSRRQDGALIQDPKLVAQRALKMAKERKVIAIDGTEIDLNAQTLCVHGDTPVAVDLVRSIRELLESDGLSVKPMGLGD